MRETGTPPAIRGARIMEIRAEMAFVMFSPRDEDQCSQWVRKRGITVEEPAKGPFRGQLPDGRSATVELGRHAGWLHENNGQCNQFNPAKHKKAATTALNCVRTNATAKGRPVACQATSTK